MSLLFKRYEGSLAQLMATTVRRQLDAVGSSTDGAVRFAIYAALGAAVGAFIALVEWVTIEVVLHELIAGPLWLQLLAPGLGLVAVALLYRLAAPLPSATSDAYIDSFHTGSGPAEKHLAGRLLASFFTLGTGGALGLEGPAILTGSTLGRWVAKFKLKSLGDRSHRSLLVAGAAAGVAAVFKAPATGVIFALEVPYRRDIARHALIPALISSAAAYVTFVIFLGAEPLLRFAPAEISLADEIVGAITLGLVGGATARGLVRLFRWAKHLGERVALGPRLAVAGLSLAGSVAITQAVIDVPLSLGPGAELAAEVVSDPGLSAWALILLFFVRALATTSALGAGGIGGVFIPLVVQGLLLGRLAEMVFDAPQTGLYPVIGLAAVLGAGYRTPLAAVMFVAESTGRAEFVIPALIATAISQSLMGEDSVSDFQVGERQGRLERRLGAPALSVALTDVGSVLPDTGLLEVIDRYGDHPISPAVPVAGPNYQGLVVLHDLAAVMLEHGIEATAADAMRSMPSINASLPAIQAARIMNEHDTAAVAVVDDDDVPIGVISALSLAGLRDIDV